jgi:hypothetical protein
MCKTRIVQSKQDGVPLNAVSADEARQKVTSRMWILDSKALSNLLPVRPFEVSTISADRPKAGCEGLKGLRLKAERCGLAQGAENSPTCT